MVKRRGAGRPRAAYESVRKEITLNENQLSKIEAAARIKGKDFSKFVRDVAIAAAHRVLKKTATCDVCDRTFSLSTAPRQLSFFDNETNVCPYCCSAVKKGAKNG